MDLLNCGICLHSYRDPRFLPCHHTFCASCIQALADGHSGDRDDFPCPKCRKNNLLGPKGADALQLNLNVPTPPRQEKLGHQELCKTHTAKKLKYYCVNCEQAICVKCKSTEHKRHATEELSSAVSRKETELQGVQRNVQQALSDVTETVASLLEDNEVLEEQIAVLETNIMNRHAVIMAAAERKKNEELLCLSILKSQLASNTARDIEEQESHSEELCKLQQQVMKAVTSGTGDDIITVSREMRSGRVIQKAINAAPSPSLLRPVVQCDISTDGVMQAIEDYLGNASLVTVKEVKCDVRVTRCFQCAQDPDVEVFSMCEIDSSPPGVWVSYEQRGMDKEAPAQLFSLTGTCLLTGVQGGKVSCRHLADVKTMSPGRESDRFKTYCKSPRAGHFLLDNNLRGQAVVMSDSVIFTEPLKTVRTKHFTILVGPHRAFDVDSTGRFFAVVEEAEDLKSWRSVRLYQQSEEKAVSTYTPPTTRFQPSDLCFYTLRGQEVLLITDEHNDAIHVATINRGTMQLNFKQFLHARSPFLVEPTAIAVGLQDQLWVACRGGNVLRMEQFDFHEESRPDLQRPRSKGRYILNEVFCSVFKQEDLTSMPSLERQSVPSMPDIQLTENGILRVYSSSASATALVSKLKPKPPRCR
ncbi:hypothetical protein ACOMHN_055548 [Nucella lapillus]